MILMSMDQGPSRRRDASDAVGGYRHIQAILHRQCSRSRVDRETTTLHPFAGRTAKHNFITAQSNGRSSTLFLDPRNFHRAVGDFRSRQLNLFRGKRIVKGCSKLRNRFVVHNAVQRTAVAPDHIDGPLFDNRLGWSRGLPVG